MPLLEMTDREAQAWATMRAAGRRAYLLRHGLGWGAIMFVGSAVVALVLGEMSRAWLALNVPLWAVAGVGFGLVTWHINERLFERRQQAT